MAPRPFLVLSAVVALGCTGEIGGAAEVGTRLDARATDDAGDGAPRDGGLDAPAAPDAWASPCPAGALCDSFEGYGVGALADGDVLGFWTASLATPGATMELDGVHVTNGVRALHVHVDQGVTAGGRIYADPGAPVLASHATHVYGRLRMYVDPSGTSVHWTFAGVEGDAEPSAPLAGNYAAYILSSLPRDGMNTFSFVDGLSGGAAYQDCWNQSATHMPVARWACVSFELDSIARHLSMSLDGTEIMTVDDTGQGCVDPVAGDSLWYGPIVDRFFVGAWSFHDMDAPLDVWIDDVVLDDQPVDCP
ncbi:MAG: hypothetical protein U0234_16240 [Sandaracinus sp.]